MSEENPTRNPLAKFGLNKSSQGELISHKEEKTGHQILADFRQGASMNIIESVKTGLVTHRANGKVARQAAETAAYHLGRTIAVELRLAADDRNALLLHEAQVRSGVRENESLRMAAKIDSDQISTTVTAIADLSEMENLSSNHVSKLKADGKIHDHQAEELEAIHSALSRDAKQDLLDRHERVKARRKDQHEQVNEFDPAKGRG